MLGCVVIKIEPFKLPKKSEIQTIIESNGFKIISVYLHIKSAIGLKIESTELKNPRKLTIESMGTVKMFANIEYVLIVLK